MKRQLPLLASFALITAASGQSVLFTETFETYVPPALIAQSNPVIWDTWSHAPGGTEDAPVTAAQAHTGTNSALWTAASATGGPNDVLLLLGDRTTGAYALDFWMYIPTGKGGYFNIQHLPALTQYAADFTFLADGTVEVLNSNTTTTGTYPHDVWFQCSLVVNLNAATATFAVDLTVVHTWPFNTPATTGASSNALSSIDFYTYAGGTDLPEFYVDDITFFDLGNVGMSEQVPTTASVYPNPANDVVTVELPNASTAAVVSLLDATGRSVMQVRSMEQRGTHARTQLNMSGLPSGLYFVRILDGDTEVVRRVTKL